MGCERSKTGMYGGYGERFATKLAGRALSSNTATIGSSFAIALAWLFSVLNNPNIRRLLLEHPLDGMEDPRAKVEAYLENNKIPQLFEAITAELLFYKPDAPREYIVKYLENAKVTGTSALITEQDLEIMFGMFDITKRGVVTAEQANRALQVILGPSADLAEVGIASSAKLSKGEFVDAMSQALKRASPYKQP
ncbi:EF-hand calcium-binding domain-containing protein 10 [Pleodorina starrii]|uniref:EF-hand calcium-binding domain-containing protein 10 n=1 Tax=Pleodorina starrii TaxID=330485 RepID=A0A9W6BDU6_9CHLO|nr:EF-hand calcium-binding domain-containing protein 10 [Pleodorina starrii]GLC50208.1 EF-hand calcium-binding domain-containing protein 10 [Pleodorina starrii]